MSCSVGGMGMEKSGANAQHENRRSLGFEETELKLGLPGVAADESRERQRICGKRSFSEAMESRNFTISHEEADKFNEPNLDKEHTSHPPADPRLAIIMKSTIAISALVGLAAASPCPYGQMAERGELSEADSKKFFAARSEGESAVEAQMEQVKRDSHARQEKYYKRQLADGLLTMGGGLLEGVLQPFTGKLSLLEVPLPQDTGLKLIPGDDAAHVYVAPTKGDVRGMCPTLNTMANHGYIDHSGITTFKQASEACQETLAFGYDTCTFLSALGLLTGGDILSGKMSIGGADSRVPNTLGPSLGNSKHGFFEVDNSISRVDAYAGNQANFNLNRWNELVAITKNYDNMFSLSAFSYERVKRYEDAKNQNPEFNAGIRWLAVTTAERVFIPRALPNGTFPDKADMRNIAPFYLNETFPKQWFRRSEPYTLAETGTDIAALIAGSPELTVPGANEGINNFVPLGLDISNTTPEAATCFLLTALFDEAPGFISGDILSGFAAGAILPFFADFNCPVTSFGSAGESAGTAGPDVGPCNHLVNGKYAC